MDLREGDVIRYRPRTNHCREGMAVVERSRDGSMIVLDTFWTHDRARVELTEGEYEVLFNLAGYYLFERGQRQWFRYAPADRARVTHQHGCQADYYILKGATEDRVTVLENARAELAEAKVKLESAIWHRDACQRLVDHLTATVTS